MQAIFTDQVTRLERGPRGQAARDRSTCSTASPPRVRGRLPEHLPRTEPERSPPSASPEAVERHSCSRRSRRPQRDRLRVLRLHRRRSTPSPTGAFRARCATPSPASTRASVTSGWSPGASPGARPATFIKLGHSRSTDGVEQIVAHATGFRSTSGGRRRIALRSGPAAPSRRAEWLLGALSVGVLGVHRADRGHGVRQRLAVVLPQRLQVVLLGRQRRDAAAAHLQPPDDPAHYVYHLRAWPLICRHDAHHRARGGDRPRAVAARRACSWSSSRRRCCSGTLRPGGAPAGRRAVGDLRTRRHAGAGAVDQHAPGQPGAQARGRPVVQITGTGLLWPS